MKASHRNSAARRQRGVYAVEFAMVFLLSFALLYAVTCYGMLLAFRVGLQNAAEDGARAGLQYQNNLEARKTRAKAVATAQSAWMPSSATATPDAQICMVDSNNCSGPPCGTAWNTRCKIVVTLTATNLQQVLPPFPSIAMPNRIVGQSSMLLDGNAQ